MREITLANLVLGDGEFLSNDMSLVARPLAGGSLEPKVDGSLAVTGTVDFTTYLNCLPLAKWRRYADVTEIRLVIDSCGGEFDLLASHLSDGDDMPRYELVAHGLGGEGREEVVCEMPADEQDVVTGFAIRPCGDETVSVFGGRWVTTVDEKRIRDIRLAIATTTFRKEEYVMRNICAVRTGIFSEGGNAASSMHMFVVDNGRTLDAQRLSDENIEVVPNPNVGGSGGFARGMMAAKDWGATHVLLMDDDVHILPESLLRTLALLRLATDDYADAFVEGAMLNMEEPSLMFEDVAWVKPDGMYDRIKGDCHVDRIGDIVRSEATDVEVDRAYGAWWYCCIPMSAVDEHGLPLPVFVRCDDVEYGMRCRPTIMAMAGICVWHERFEGRFRASVDSYQLTRNFLVMAACDDLPASVTTAFMLRFDRTFHIYLRAMAYDTCELMLRGLADYLRGPMFLASADGQAIMAENAKLNERLEDVESLDRDIVDRATPDPAYLGGEGSRGMAAKLLEGLPHDRHMLPDALLSDEPAPVYYCRGAYPAKRTIGRKTLVAYDATGTKAHIRKMDRKRWNELRAERRRLMGKYLSQGGTVANEWHDAAPWLASREFWEKYLDDRA